MIFIEARYCELILSRRDINRSRVVYQINLTSFLFRRCLKDFKTMNEERDDDKNDEKEEAKEEEAIEKNRAQVEEIKLNESKKSRT